MNGAAHITQNAHVTLLLALHNGAPFLKEQLDSFSAQTHQNWSLIVSDDGSHDKGPDIVRQFASSHPKREISLLDGPKMGFARNFLRLLQQVDPSVPFAGFSDQDDVWLPNKLEQGLVELSKVPENQPAMYTSRTMICDDGLTPLRPSPLFRRPPGFRNALVQNMAAGNTIILNRTALDLLQDAAKDTRRIVAHDWWVYQMVSGAGGVVIYDPTPRVLYRQHSSNQIGANDSVRAVWHRIRLLLTGRFSTWNRVNIIALTASAHRLTPENRALLRSFRAIRRQGLFSRLLNFRKLRLYRQSIRSNATLWLAVLIRRI